MVLTPPAPQAPQAPPTQKVRASYKPLRLQRFILEVPMREIERRSGVSRWIITRAERGQGDLRLGQLLCIAQALGVPYTTLFEIVR